MASAIKSVTVIKRSSVSPLSSSAMAATGMSLPLTFVDMVWLHFLPIERLMFYDIPRLSRDHFIDHLVPGLEHSLSLVLEHFLPLAGNLIIPSSSDSSSSLPEIRYVQGDSVTTTFAECNEIDLFSYLTADDARNCREFHSFIPELFKPSFYLDDDSDADSAERRIPVLRIQVTLFPNLGIAIGISNHHAVGDASAIFNFMKTWASLHSQLTKQNIDAVSCENLQLIKSPPFCDRTIIKDPKGLASIYFQRWNRIMKSVKSSSFPMDAFFNRVNINVRRTFVISRKDVEKLKTLAVKHGEKPLHLSSFTVACAYVWTCLVKSRVPSGEEVSEEEPEHFSFFAECRGRIDPPLPENYFGNCLAHCVTTSEHGKLVSEEGFQIAAELIGKTIHERLKSSDTLFSGAEKWMDGSGSGGGNWERDVGVAGSPKYDYYNLDFGWGKPRKFEFVSIDITGAISLSRCREPDGAMEVGLSLSKPKMDAFTIIFREGLDIF